VFRLIPWYRLSDRPCRRNEDHTSFHSIHGLGLDQVPPPAQTYGTNNTRTALGAINPILFHIVVVPTTIRRISSLPEGAAKLARSELEPLSGVMLWKWRRTSVP
jgi:hypothetical protein